MKSLADIFVEFTNNKSEVKENTSSDDRVLIVDGLNSYVRCFAATPTMDDDGEHIGGVTGFLKSVAFTIRNVSPSRVILVFDGKGGSKARQELYPDYKDNRKPSERLNRTYDFNSKEKEKESMKWQLRLLIDACGNLPVTVMAIDNVEADDVIAYLAGLVNERGGESVIMSTDKDFLQLVSDTCKVYNPIKKKTYDVQTVLDEFGIHPNNFLLYRMLDGDKSDNIEGVKGIGLKTFKKLVPTLSEAGELTSDGLFEICEKSNAAVAAKILENKEVLTRNRQLMDLKNLSFSQSIKMSILEQYNFPIPKLNKMELTKLFVKFKLMSAFGNYNEWVATTWLKLSKFSS